VGLWQAVVSSDGPWIFVVSLAAFTVVLFIGLRIVIPYLEEKEKNKGQTERKRRQQIEILRTCITAGVKIVALYGIRNAFM
jgi:heme/copper-type cytochrome/quinol oxidase subunit 2